MAVHLPATGIYTDDGELFHHVYCDPLKEIHYERLKAHGINSRSHSHFTPEEILLMFRNWKRYCEKYEVDIRSARDYFGYMKGQNATKERRLQIKEQNENKLWPEMCQGMPYRNAYSVRCRVKNIMTPEIFDELNFDNTDEMLMLIKERFFKKRKGQKFTEDSETEENKENRTFWKRGLMEQEFKASLIEEDDSFSSFGDDLKWKKIAKKVGVDKESVHQKWQELRKKIKKKFKKLKKETGWNGNDVYQLTRVDIFGKDFEYEEKHCFMFLEILCKCVVEDVEFRIDSFDFEKVENLVAERGIQYFNSNKKITEIKFLFRAVKRRYMQVHKHLFAKLVTKFPLKTRLLILLWGWKAHFDWKSSQQARENEAINEYASKKTRKFLKKENVAKWIDNHFRDSKYIGECVYKTCSEALVLYMEGQDFTFPSALSFLIESKIVRDLIQSESNEEYLSLDRAKQLISNIVPDEIVKVVNAQALRDAFIPEGKLRAVSDKKKAIIAIERPGKRIRKKLHDDVNLWEIEKRAKPEDIEAVEVAEKDVKRRKNQNSKAKESQSKANNSKRSQRITSKEFIHSEDDWTDSSDEENRDVFIKAENVKIEEPQNTERHKCLEIKQEIDDDGIIVLNEKKKRKRKIKDGFGKNKRIKI